MHEPNSEPREPNTSTAPSVKHHVRKKSGWLPRRAAHADPAGTSKEKKVTRVSHKNLKKQKQMHIKKFDKSCIKVCIRRHALHRTGWTDGAKRVDGGPSAAGWFVQSGRTRAAALRTGVSKLIPPPKHKKKNHGTEGTMSGSKGNRPTGGRDRRARGAGGTGDPGGPQGPVVRGQTATRVTDGSRFFFLLFFTL